MVGYTYVHIVAIPVSEVHVFYTDHHYYDVSGAEGPCQGNNNDMVALQKQESIAIQPKKGSTARAISSIYDSLFKAF